MTWSIIPVKYEIQVLKPDINAIQLTSERHSLKYYTALTTSCFATFLNSFNDDEKCLSLKNIRT